MLLNRQLQHAHELIISELLENIEYRAQWFMNMALGLIPELQKLSPDLTEEQLFKLADSIMENTIAKMFGIELSAETTRKSLQSIKNN